MISRQILEEKIKWYNKTASTAFTYKSFASFTSGLLVPCGVTQIPVGIVLTSVPSTDATTNALPVDISSDEDEFIMDIAQNIGYTPGVAFTVGHTVKGATSGATGLIIADTGTVLTVVNITGAFVAGEAIAETNGSGAATAITLAKTLSQSLVGTYIDVAANPAYVNISVSTTLQILVTGLLPVTNQITGTIAKRLED